jgi:hypothetical protein
MDGTKPDQSAGRPDAFQLLEARDELNLAEFPIALLADRPPKGTKTVEFQDRIYDRGAGKEIARKLTITGSDRYGLPTALDDEVILGLIHLTKLSNGFTDRVVRFKRYELVALLGWPMDGRSYRRIVDSLNRWLGVTLHYENAWWDKRQKTWVTRGFHIIDSFEILDGRSSKVPDGEPDLLYSHFSWNEFVFRSFQAGNLKQLDLDRYFRLRSAISKRMLRFLDKRFHFDRAQSFDLREFACEHIGLSRTYPPTKLKRSLQGAIEELETIGFLEPLGPQSRYTQVRRGEWTIHLIQQSPEAERRPPKPEPTELERALIDRGVSPMMAVQLAQGHPEERVRTKVEAFDWLLTRKDRRVAKNPAGYLVASIRDDYAAPKGFESEADRAHRLETDQGRRSAQDEARRHGKDQEGARQEAQQARITAHWDSLSPAQREAIETQALAGSHPLLGLYRRHHGQGTPAEKRYRKLIIDAHILELLGEGPD